MKVSTLVTALGGVAAVAAAPSICDKYTAALLGKDNAANQETLLTLLVNTVVIGNYSSVNTGVAVPGILAPGKYNGERVNLLPYFDGALKSTNNGGPCGVSVNFLDGGGAAPLKQNKPADDPNSNQYALLTHLYQFFASLLGCSKFGNTVSPYAGDPSMYQVHKFMALDSAEFGYFVQQVALAAESFGVTDNDVTAVGNALYGLFGNRCEAAQSIPPVSEPELQSICTECDCPLADNPTCSAYGKIKEPRKATSQARCPAGHTCGSQ